MDRIEELLTRGVDRIYPSMEELKQVLLSGKKLKLYQGFDPTGTQLHIGHMVGLNKLRQWQDLGHHVIFLIGDGTGQAGDPSGKTTSRDKFFTREELRTNSVDYVKQARKVVRFEGENPIEILFNGDWLNKLNLVDILNIANHFTLSQLAERDLYRERQKKDQEVNLREFMYPLLQAYDSVAMSVDLELGGTDQTFNMLMGRHLVKAMLHKDKFVMTTPLLSDSKGIKIGKTEGNAISLTDSPKDLYAKIMTFPDDVIGKAFEYLTDVPMKEVREIERKIKDGQNPMQFKKQLAFEITQQLNSKQEAEEAKDAFESTVQKKELPVDIQEITLNSEDSEFLNEDLLVDLNLATSKSEAKRLFEQGGVEFEGKKITDPSSKVSIAKEGILRVGKRKIIRIKPAP